MVFKIIFDILGGRNISLQLNNNPLANSINGKIENGSFFKKLGIEIMNPNIKLLSPNIKKENFFISNQQSPLPLNVNNNKFTSSLNNKISVTKTNNYDQVPVNGNSNKSVLNGKTYYIIFISIQISLLKKQFY